MKLRRQRPIRGGRMPSTSSVIPEIEAAVEYVAHKHRVSKSWVRATAIAEFFDIDIERYDEVKKSK